MGAGSEKRQAPRASKAFLIHYRASSSVSDKAGWSASPLRNISETGVNFLSEQRFPAGTVLEMQLLLPTAPEPLFVKGAVVHVSQPTPQLAQFGVHFIDPDVKTQEAIRRAIGRSLKRTD